MSAAAAALARFACGVCAGVLLASARLPLGRTLFEVPLVSPEARYAARALALAACALVGCGAFVGRGSPGAAVALLGGALGGWLVASFAIHPWIGPGVELACVAAAALVATCAGTARLARESIVEEPDRTRASLLALLVVGAAATLALERLGQHLHRFGAGLDLDAGVFGAVFLALVAVGALCFGHLPRAIFGPSGEKRTLPITLSLVSILALLGFALVRGLASARGLERFLRNLGLDGSLHGTLAYDLALAVPILVAPAFALGAALAQTRVRGELAAILAGAAIAMAAYPAAFELTFGLVAGGAGRREEMLATTVAFASTGLLVLGMSESTLLRRSERSNNWFSFLMVLASGVAILAMFLEPARVAILSPWENRVVLPERVIETPAGTFVVESAGESMRVVRCDGRALTPEPALLGAEAQRIEWSLDLLAPEQRAGGRVLLVGQLSPERAELLVEHGAALVDRTGVWYERMDALENALFAATSIARPAGEIVSPARARERLDAGAYDLVLVPPVAGEVPVLPAVDSPPGTVVVIWLDGSGGLFAQALPEQGLLSTDAFEGLAIGLVHGATRDARADAGGPVFLPLGEPGARWQRLRWLSMRQAERKRSARAALAARIAEAARGGEHASLARGLALHWAAQRASSPLDPAERRVELDGAALAELSLAARAQPLDRLTRAIWEGIAHLLAAKRDVEQVYEQLAPLAAEHAPWPALELALAEADIESLEPASAIERLRPIVPDTAADPRLVWMLARAHSAAGEHERAAALLERMIAAGIAWRDLARAQAIELFLAGDPRGRPLLEDLARARPQDVLLRRLLDRGPEEGDGGFDPTDPWEGARGG